MSRAARAALSSQIKTGLLWLAICFCLPIAATAQPVTQVWLQEETDRLQKDHDLIAMGAGVLIVGHDPVIAVSGTRYKGSDIPVTTDDAWHIGSNTKALTALLYARLVMSGEAEWGATLPELFPSLAEDMAPDWTQTQIEDLLSHRSGIGDIGLVWLFKHKGSKASLPKQRLETARQRLSEPPQGHPGEFEYSNLNYILAGAAIEELTGQSWESAMRSNLLQLDGANWAHGWGFGPPPKGLQGHQKGLFGPSPAGRGSGADNPEALGPAGTVHVPIASHLQLLVEFVTPQSEFLPEAQRQHLLAPWPDNSADYALGWAVQDDDRLGRVYRHNGSNTMWLSRVELVPSRNAVIIVNANQYNDASLTATAGLLDAIEEKLAEMTP